MRHLLGVSLLIVGSLAFTWVAASLLESKAYARAAISQATFKEPPPIAQAWSRSLAQSTRDLRFQ
jgi:hypothetical protein